MQSRLNHRNLSDTFLLFVENRYDNRHISLTSFKSIPFIDNFQN